jgi:hypothetical protein
MLMLGLLKRFLPVIGFAAVYIAASTAHAATVLEYYTEGFFTDDGSALQGNDASYSITNGAGYPPVGGTAIASPYTGSSKLVITGKDSDVGTLTYNYSGLQTATFPAGGMLTGINMGTFTIVTDNPSGTSFAGNVFGFDLDIFQIDPTTGQTSLVGTVDGTATDGSSAGDVAIHFSDTPDNDNVTVGTDPGVFYQLLNSAGITVVSTRITTEVFNVANGGTGSDTVLANATELVGLPQAAPAGLMLMGGLLGFTAIRHRMAAKRDMAA